jgi:hypothetical protein
MHAKNRLTCGTVTKYAREGAISHAGAAGKFSLKESVSRDSVVLNARKIGLPSVGGMTFDS